MYVCALSTYNHQPSSNSYTIPIIQKQELKYGTETYYGWSYVVGWVGIVECLVAAIMFISAARCIRSEKRTEQAKNMQYLMPVYPDKRAPYAYSYAYPSSMYNYPQQHMTSKYCCH